MVCQYQYRSAGMLGRATWFPPSTGVGLLVSGTPLVLMYAVAFFLQSVN